MAKKINILGATGSIGRSALDVVSRHPGEWQVGVLAAGSRAVEYKRSTERTITSTEALLPVLDQVRERGYGEDNEEQEEGLRCIAVPVFDRFGVVIAGLSISFPTLRFSEERLQEYVAMLHTAARKISAQMGYHDYPF